MSDSEKTSGFKVTDRRSFSENGAAESAPTAQGPVAETPAPQDQSQARAGEDSNPVFPPADFSTFLLSLGSSALIHLGEIEPPGETAKRHDLPMAKHTIDLLTLLREKTQSNLTPEEDKLLDSLLYDLRLRYVEALKAGS
jgi:hypothetical protein